LLAGLGLGPVVWALTSAAISLRTGVWPWDLAPDAAAGAAGGLVGGLVAAAAAGTSQDAATLLASAALAPAGEAALCRACRAKPFQLWRPPRPSLV
jgi:hypothetical protein